MNRLGSFAALIVSVLVFQPAPTAQAQRSTADAPPVTFRGVVVDDETGAGVPRTRLDFLIGAKRAAGVFTRDDGSFSVDITSQERLSIAPFASVVVKTFKAGYAVVTLVFTPVEARAPGGVRIVLPKAGVITGRVVASSSALPPTTIVFARRNGDGATLSQNVFTAGPTQVISSTIPDEDGNFRLGGLPAGRYTVETPLLIPESSGGVLSAASAGGLRMPSVVVDVAAGTEVSGVNLVYERVLEEPPAVPAEPAGGSIIRGRVTSTDGVPLSDAQVNARLGGRSWNATTDVSGQFALRNLPPGSFTVSATRRGYLRSEYGQRGAKLPGLPIVVDPDKKIDNVTIMLSPGTVISGLVLDEHNEPLPEISIQLSRVRQTPAGMAIVDPSGGGAATDDRGMFKIRDVRPGDYLMTAVMPSEIATGTSVTRTAYVPAFYPDSLDAASALPLRLQAGDILSGVVLTIRRAPVVRVSGVVQNSQGTPFAGSVRLTQRHIASFALPPRVIQPNTSGEFLFSEVPPGEYVLRASVPSGPNGPEAAERILTIVDSDAVPLTMRTMPNSTVSGRFVLDGTPGELLWGYSIRTSTADATISASSFTTVGSPISEGDTFRITALSGLTRITVSPDDDDWYLRSISINGVDATDTPFDFGFEGREYSSAEIVFSRSGASVTGRATDDRAIPVDDYAVHVFATDRDRWFTGSRWLRLVRSAGDGTFRLSALPPGDYWLAAIDRVDTLADREWLDTELLESLTARATRVSLGEGQSQTMTLRVIRR